MQHQKPVNVSYGLCSIKKETKRYAAYLMLCDYFGLHDEFDEEEKNDE